MRIRRARPGDYEACAALEREGFALHYGSRPDLLRDRETPLPREYFAALLAGEAIFLVAEEGGEVVGLAEGEKRGYRGHFNYNDLEWLQIDTLVVTASRRGQGIGTALFAAMKAEARALGLSRIELTVWGFNEAAKRFYARQGMRALTERLELNL